MGGHGQRPPGRSGAARAALLASYIAKDPARRQTSRPGAASPLVSTEDGDVVSSRHRGRDGVNARRPSSLREGVGARRPSLSSEAVCQITCAPLDARRAVAPSACSCQPTVAEQRRERTPACSRDPVRAHSRHTRALRNAEATMSILCAAGARLRKHVDPAGAGSRITRSPGRCSTPTTASWHQWNDGLVANPTGSTNASARASVRRPMTRWCSGCGDAATRRAKSSTSTASFGWNSIRSSRGWDLLAVRAFCRRPSEIDADR